MDTSLVPVVSSKDTSTQFLIWPNLSPPLNGSLLYVQIPGVRGFRLLSAPNKTFRFERVKVETSFLHELQDRCAGWGLAQNRLRNLFGLPTGRFVNLRLPKAKSEVRSTRVLRSGRKEILN